MTRTYTISKSPLLVALAALIAAAFVAIAPERADAASISTVKVTCYSDGYLTVSDGGNVASAPQFLRLRIGYRTSAGLRWVTYAWRPVNGGSFRLNATRGATYFVYATIATRTSTGFAYSSGYVSVTNVKVSPIGAVMIDSRTTGLCKT